MLIDKPALRREALARRDALLPALRTEASLAIVEGVSAALSAHAAGPVAGYMPIRSEVDPRPAMQRLAERGFSLALPRIVDDDLVFHDWRADAPLTRGAFGIPEPEATTSIVRPVALLVPMAAFDRRGHRIGYGRGFYDRAIERLAHEGPVVTIGLAFSVQETQAVPAETHDRALDWIVTEREVMSIKTSENPHAPSLSR